MQTLLHSGKADVYAVDLPFEYRIISRTDGKGADFHFTLLFYITLLMVDVSCVL